MTDFDYSKMLEQIRKEKNERNRSELFDFIGEKGDDRFIEPLIELLKTDDSPAMRFSLYSAFSKIGSDLAEEIIKKKVKSKLPKDDGKPLTKKEWKAAVDFLAKELEDPFIDKIEQYIETQGPLWSVENQGGVGIYIRNLLRNNGFDLGHDALEMYWSWIVEDALQKRRKKRKSKS